MEIDKKDLVIRAAVLRDNWMKQQDWTGVTQTTKTEMCCSKIYEIYTELADKKNYGNTSIFKRDLDANFGL